MSETGPRSPEGPPPQLPQPAAELIERDRDVHLFVADYPTVARTSSCARVAIPAPVVADGSPRPCWTQRDRAELMAASTRGPVRTMGER